MGDGGGGEARTSVSLISLLVVDLCAPLSLSYTIRERETLRTFPVINWRGLRIVSELFSRGLELKLSHANTHKPNTRENFSTIVKKQRVLHTNFCVLKITSKMRFLHKM